MNPARSPLGPGLVATLLITLTPALAADPQPRWALGLGAGAISFPPWPGSSHRNEFISCTGAWSDGHSHCWYSEPWFAPADNQRSEDHGYVVSFVWNARERTQQLQVFDALDISRGPVARAHLPQRVPAGFHACWVKPGQIGPRRAP